MDPPPDPTLPFAQAPPTLVVHEADAPLQSPKSSKSSPRRSFYLASPASTLLSPLYAMSSDGDGSDTGPAPSPAAPNPFNFQTQVISTSPVKSNIGQRRGHKYKHSSVSAQHQIFQEPPPRPPAVLPASLPIPTLSEACKSMRREQRNRLYWSGCHVAVAIFIFFRSEGSLAAMALSHLVFFDAGSAALSVAVEVLGNFEAWRRSSIRHPFGLERVEVLAGFALSIFLLFGGFDLVSHNLKHFLESMGHHEAHHEHSHSHTTSASVMLVAAVAAASSLISAYGVKNHARIAKLMRVSYLSNLPSVLSNPFHFLTLFFSSLIATLPLVSMSLYTWLDGIICAVIALAMFGLGMRVAIAQGLMLLMSYGGNRGNEGVSAVLREIESESAVSKIDEAQFWQVHYGLCIATITLRVAKSCDELSLCKLRNRIASLIQNRLGEGYGTGGSVRWEVTLQMSSEA